MKQDATVQLSPRRVGAVEGVLHMLGAAGVFVLFAQAFDPAVMLAVPPAAGVFWAGWYGALRAARVREWFGQWDCVSFSFVCAYAVAVAVAALVMVN